MIAVPAAFTRITDSLYEIGSDSPANTTFLYFVTAQTPSPGTGPVSLDDSWANAGFPGWYVFLPHEILQNSAGAFVRSVRRVFPSPGIGAQNIAPQRPFASSTSNRTIVWLQDATQPTANWRYSLLPLVQINPRSSARKVFSDNDFSWGALTLRIGANLTDTLQVTLNTDEGLWEIKRVSSSPIAENFVQILFNNSPQTLGYYDDSWLIHVFFAGPQCGCFSFKAALDPALLIATFGCEFRFIREKNGKPVLLTYPFLSPVVPQSPVSDYPGFNFWLHPLFAEDTLLTRLALDLSSGEPWANNSAELSAGNFLSTGGHGIILKPHSPKTTSPGSGNIPDSEIEPASPGFAFCHSLSASGTEVLYLAPVGNFVFSDQPGSPPSPGIELMAGLFANEFLSFAPGDIIGFQAGAAAYAGGVSGSPAETGSKTGSLSTRTTTAWVLLGGPPARPGRGYFNQPSESAYYGETGSGRFPLIVNSCLSELSAPVTFPMVPYGGLSFAGSPAGSGDAPAEDYAAMEKENFAPLRGSGIGIGPLGPVFSGIDEQADFYRPAAANRFSYSFTPEGLLVRLNQTGGWQNLILARSPVDQKLFGFSPASGATLNTTLSGTLIQDQLFLVISKSQYLDDFADTLNVGGFNLEAAVDQGALLVFKFTDSRSLLELSADSTAWTAADKFVGDAADIEAVQQHLQNLFVQAGAAVTRNSAGAAGKQDPFAYFQQIAVQPEWTGILVFDGLIDGNGMPPDLQILLAGIPGPQLRAHHFGIQANNLNQNSPQTGDIKHSSIFGVIHYQAPPAPSPPQASAEAFRYIVQKLTVVFANSAITTFNVTIELTINKLFDRAVFLAPRTPASPAAADNTIFIHGQYQKSGAVGHIKFVTEQAHDFVVDTANKNLRVVEKVRLTGIALNPGKPQVASASPADTELSANFSLDGQIWFAQNPFSIHEGLDLLSFGNPDADAAMMPWETRENTGKGLGLNFTNMTIQLSFILYANGAVGPVHYEFIPSAAQLAPDSDAIREDSLLFDLPLTCTNLRHDPKGLDPKSLGALPVHCLQLETLSGSGSPPSKAPSPFTTTSPTYALEFDLPLGSLGSLSSVHAGLDASLFLAWGPSPVVPDSDAMSIMVKLPALDAGFKGFNLQGVLKTTFSDANLMKVEVQPGDYVYAVMFNNVALSVLGYDFPPGVMVDFILFAGAPGNGSHRNKSNIAWYLAAMSTKKTGNENMESLSTTEMIRMANDEDR